MRHTPVCMRLRGCSRSLQGAVLGGDFLNGGHFSWLTGYPYRGLRGPLQAMLAIWRRPENSLATLIAFSSNSIDSDYYKRYLPAYPDQRVLESRVAGVSSKQVNVRANEVAKST